MLAINELETASKIPKIFRPGRRHIQNCSLENRHANFLWVLDKKFVKQKKQNKTKKESNLNLIYGMTSAIESLRKIT